MVTKGTCPIMSLDFTDTGSRREWFGHFKPQQIRWSDTHLQIQIMCYGRDGWDSLSFIFLNLTEPSVIVDHEEPFWFTPCHSFASLGITVMDLLHCGYGIQLILLLPESMTCFQLHLFCTCACALPLHSRVTSMALLELCVAERIVAEVKAHFRAIFQTTALGFRSIVRQSFQSNVHRYDRTWEEAGRSRWCSSLQVYTQISFLHLQSSCHRHHLEQRKQTFKALEY